MFFSFDQGRYLIGVKRSSRSDCLFLPLPQELRALEGQSVTLRCKARGDPDPIIHWIAPDGRLMSNSSRAVVHTDGTLDILISTVKDSGLFTLHWLGFYVVDGAELVVCLHISMEGCSIYLHRVIKFWVWRRACVLIRGKVPVTCICLQRNVFWHFYLLTINILDTWNFPETVSNILKCWLIKHTSKTIKSYCHYKLQLVKHLAGNTDLPMLAFKMARKLREVNW